MLVSSGLIAVSGAPASATVVNGCDTTGTTYPAATGTVGFGGGEGTSASPWLICSRAQLSGIATNANTLAAEYLLKSDIDLSVGGSFVPIGPIFSGVFDGEYRTLSGATIGGDPDNGATHPEALSSDPDSDRETDLYGLFAMVSGDVSKLEISGFTVDSDSNVKTQAVVGSTSEVEGAFGDEFPMSGALTGSCFDGGKISELRITNTVVTGYNASLGLVVGSSISCELDLIDASNSSNKVFTEKDFGANQTNQYLGGIVGRVTYFNSSEPGTKIKRAVFGGIVGGNGDGLGNKASVVPDQYSGGILGAVENSSVKVLIDQSLMSGVIVDSDETQDRVGGIVGNMSDGGASGFGIRNSIFSGEMKITPDLNDTVGGIAAAVSTTTPFVNTLNVGEMPQTGSAVGPIVGANVNPPYGTYTNALYDSTILSTFNDANEYGDGKTTAQLQDADLDTGTFATWPMALSGSAAATTSWTLATTDPLWRITQGSYPSLIWRDFWPGRPSAPASVTATTPSAGTAALSWTGSNQVGFDAVTGYKIEKSSDGGATWTVETANTSSLSTTATVTGLTPGASYLFRVSGIAASGAGLPTSTTAALLLGSNPGSPQNLSAVRLTDNSFRISWDPPTNTGGLSLTGYTLQVDKGNGFETVTHTGTSADITGVTINSLWSFRVLARNVVGDSAYATFTNTPPAPYSGPLVTNLSMFELTSGVEREVRVEGIRLDSVSSGSVDGKAIAILSKSANEMLIRVPALLTGIKDLVLVSSAGNLTHQDAFNVLVQEATVISESETRKLNAGSFKGYVALYARGYEGQRLSAKVGNDWVIVPQIVNNQENGNLFRFVEFTGAGYTINVRMFIDRVLIFSKVLVTK